MPVAEMLEMDRLDKVTSGFFTTPFKISPDLAQLIKITDTAIIAKNICFAFIAFSLFLNVTRAVPLLRDRDS